MGGGRADGGGPAGPVVGLPGPEAEGLESNSSRTSSRSERESSSGSEVASTLGTGLVVIVEVVVGGEAVRFGSGWRDTNSSSEERGSRAGSEVYTAREKRQGDSSHGALLPTSKCSVGRPRPQVHGSRA